MPKQGFGTGRGKAAPEKAQRGSLPSPKGHKLKAGEGELESQIWTLNTHSPGARLPIDALGRCLLLLGSASSAPLVLLDTTWAGQAWWITEQQPPQRGGGEGCTPMLAAGKVGEGRESQVAGEYIEKSIRFSSRRRRIQPS